MSLREESVNISDQCWQWASWSWLISWPTCVEQRAAAAATVNVSHLLCNTQWSGGMGDAGVSPPPSIMVPAARQVAFLSWQAKSVTSATKETEKNFKTMIFRLLCDQFWTSQWPTVLTWVFSDWLQEIRKNKHSDMFNRHTISWIKSYQGNLCQHGPLQ